MFHYKCGRFAIIGVMTVLTVLVTATCNLQLATRFHDTGKGQSGSIPTAGRKTI